MPRHTPYKSVMSCIVRSYFFICAETINNTALCMYTMIQKSVQLTTVSLKLTMKQTIDYQIIDFIFLYRPESLLPPTGQVLSQLIPVEVRSKH